ncbi:MAG: B12-binding domain-containing radical SAM protein [Chloroflexi bacterium]|nr:B12-binding domain-containing radical SAM protein [Chloroflexota bacterium]
MKILFVYPVIGQSQTFHYGIGSLSAVLKKAGHDTSLLKLTSDKPGPAMKAVASLVPDLVAISCTSVHWELVKRFAGEIKKQCSVPVIVGGSHTTMFPDTILETRSVDGICRGEGEEALLELVDRLSKGADYRGTGNFWFRDGDSIIKNDLRPLIEDLDALPAADRTVFPRRDILAYTNFTFSRGCPYNCTYCCNHAIKAIYKGKGPAIRFRSVRSAFKEIEDVVNSYRPSELNFDDDCFSKSSEWLEEFCSQYPKLFGIPFHCNARPELFDKRTAILLKSAGCVGVAIGIESGDQTLRRQVLKRGMSNEDIVNAFAVARECGLRTSSFNMIGIPGETPETFQKTIELNRIAKPDALQLTTYYPFRGSELGELAKEKGYIDEGKLLTTSSYMSDSVLRLPAFPRREINRLRRSFHRQVFKAYSPRKAVLYLVLSLLPVYLKDNVPSPLVKLKNLLLR